MQISRTKPRSRLKAATLVLLLGLLSIRSSANSNADSHASHTHCGWIGADTAEAGIATFSAQPDSFDAIHPKWFTLKPDGSPRSIPFTDDARILTIAKAHQVRLIPLIDSDSADYIRHAFASAESRAAHASALTQLVVSRGYDGIELDYEHLWNRSDRAPFIALVSAVADALHAQGKILTMALPALAYDDGSSAYDYAALSRSADVLHLMAYDYHYLGSHLGPLAPKGWVEAVISHAQSVADPSRFVLGLANYAIGGDWYSSARAAMSRCRATYEPTTDHMQSCPFGHEEAGRAPHCQTDRGEGWFEDPQSLEEKATMAKSHGLRGIGYWTVGEEPDGFFEALRGVYP
jgi:spore germination protein